MTDTRDTDDRGDRDGQDDRETVDQPLDEIDEAILAEIAELYGWSDPPPLDLDERVQFAIALEDLDVVVSRLQEDLLAGTGARGAERARTVTFDADSLTIMVTVTETDDDGIRVDGWLAPSGPLRVELRVAADHADARGESMETTADDAGRFVFTGVGAGLAQLKVHPSAGSGVALATTVVTPSIML